MLKTTGLKMRRGRKTTNWSRPQAHLKTTSSMMRRETRRKMKTGWRKIQMRTMIRKKMTQRKKTINSMTTPTKMMIPKTRIQTMRRKGLKTK
jgi:hypothetical protein